MNGSSGSSSSSRKQIVRTLLIWYLSKEHSWAEPVQRRFLVDHVVEDDELGFSQTERQEITGEVLNEFKDEAMRDDSPMMYSPRKDSFGFRSSVEAHRLIAYYLRRNLNAATGGQVDDFIIDTYLSRFSGFDETDPPDDPDWPFRV